MSDRPGTSPSDEELVRAAARRVGWQIAVASAIALAVTGGIALIVTRLLQRPRTPGTEGPHDFDDALRTVALIGGVVGIAAAGAIGFLIARRAVAPLGQALALQHRFVADAGHELRTPLTVLHTRAQMIARRMRADDPARPAVQQLLDDSRVLSDIVDDLLTSAQLRSPAAHTEEFDLVEVARSVADELRILADGAGIELTVEVPDGCPIRGSRTAIRRAVTALVDNALAHTPPGGTVTIQLGRDGAAAVLRVVDSGEGLAGDGARLLERFAQADPGRGTVTGSPRYGLGLSLVREIAIGHHGSFDLRENPRGGTIASITVPGAG
jgi:signal transduction histidine kinase